MLLTERTKCKVCATQAVAIAKEKPCWEGKLCNDRCSWYRRKDLKNQKRRLKYSLAKKTAVPAPKIPDYAICYVERLGGAKDSKIVGMWGEFYRKGSRIDCTEPLRLHGMPTRKWKEYSSSIAQVFADKYGVGKFEQIIEIDVSEKNSQ